ncbi:uncharacterized protein LOC126906077 isoform X2 [Daktulosphaira vitifoliae]|uniref:uncharacterized protein LOC126906077 isoform X2 n=1 Tax=Daktulosphaira vitifoliae TaxID=58002 RepID=UPI0021AAAFEB|nr:uncharacterized protein LOC126906077 isoform X2 [Daktulosphaira vitifoliae]
MAYPRLRHYRTMTAICFVCNLPILSHQVGLVWQGGNGWDDILREQMEETTLKQRLGGRRDSAAQITTESPPTETAETSPPVSRRRRRSSLAQLTDILREWSGTGMGGGGKSGGRPKGITRRETLADIAKTLPFGRSNTITSSRKRRESSVDSGIKSSSSKGRRDSKNDFRADIAKLLNNRRDSVITPSVSQPRRRGSTDVGRPSDLDGRRGSRDGGIRQHRTCHKRRDSQAIVPGLSTSSNGSGDGVKTTEDHTITPPTMVISSVTPPPTSPCVPSPTNQQAPTAMATASVSCSYTPPVSSPSSPVACVAPQLTSGMSHAPPVSRRDSTTQVYSRTRRSSKPHVSPERRHSKDGGIGLAGNKLSRLQRQSTAIDESCLPAGALSGRRSSQPTLSAEQDWQDRKTRRDSLSPDSANYARRRDSRGGLSPDRQGRDVSPGRNRRRRNYRRQSTTMGSYNTRNCRTRSPESSSSCSSREPSPVGRSVTPAAATRAPIIRRQSTTEEILIARGFRRQSTTEEMIRCRNFRRLSSQSDECYRTRGRRDSSTQIIDGTLATMAVETSSTLFDSSTQTETSLLYDNKHYHEECLRCNSCGMNLTGPNQKRARRFKNHILCDLHFADVALMECSDFMQQLRSFKPQSLGCAVARRKSSTTLIFPLPPQACGDDICEEWPHNFQPAPGYWIECSRQKITSEAGCVEESGSDERDMNNGSNSDGGEGAPDYCCSRYGRARGSDSLLLEDDEYYPYDDDYVIPPSRPKTSIEEQWEKNRCFELTSVEQETFERYFYQKEHWNYFTNDEDLGPVILSLKQESINGRDQFRILVRAISYTVHGLIPASCVFADRYNREEVVRSLGKEINLNPPLVLGQLPDTADELLKLDQVFMKSELKVGVIYVKEGQTTEEEILDNNENSIAFEEFLGLLGETKRLCGFDKYRGGLDTVHDLTGTHSVYTNWRNIEIMFHVSTMLPYEAHDAQKLQRKRHIGNDIVCVVFLEADNTRFSPACIKSHFLHTFILVRVSPRIRRKTERTKYEVSVVTRDEVGAYKPYLWEQSVFEEKDMFREWILTKIVNGERASYSAPKFARMQERTRSQMLEDIVANLQNHCETGQIPKPYRRGSWRPIGHMRPSSPLLDSVRDRFEDYDTLAKDFTKFFINSETNVTQNGHLFDVVFLVGQSKQKTKFIGVRAILGVRSRVFQEMLYGISTGFGSPQMPVAELLARGLPSLPSQQQQKTKSSNFLQVPDIETPRAKSVPSSPMMRRAFTRLGTLTAGWSKSIRKQQNLTVDDKKKWASSQDFSHKEKEKDREKEKERLAQLSVPKVSVCPNNGGDKIDRAKLNQTEFSIIEFDPDTFRILLDYLHTSSCKITCANVPGLICAAEHYDLPELLQACFHHTKQHLRVDVICLMLNSLENYVWRYNSAVELVNLIFTYIEQNALRVLNHCDFLTLSESLVQQIMSRPLEVSEIRKFQAMIKWATTKSESKTNAKEEFHHIMTRLKKDINLVKIAPNDLINIVLPTRTVDNQDILATLCKQAGTGEYKIEKTVFERLSRHRSDWDHVEPYI